MFPSHITLPCINSVSLVLDICTL